MQRPDRYTDRYGIATALVVLTMFAMAVSTTAWWSRMLALVIEGGTMLFILWTSAVTPRVFQFAAVTVALAIVFSGLTVVRGGTFETQAIYAVGALLAVGAPVAIARHLLAELRITAATVLGALCIYLIGGLLFAYLYALGDAHDQGHFFVQVTHAPSVDYFYFSLVTLTTVGYGDLTASGSFGKMLAVTEALAGQLYLVSVVAVLVSNLGRERTPRQPHGSGGSSRKDDAG
jgi:hypothetical protein